MDAGDGYANPVFGLLKSALPKVDFAKYPEPVNLKPDEVPVLRCLLWCQTLFMASYSSPFPFSVISSTSNLGEIRQCFHCVLVSAQPGVNINWKQKEKALLQVAALGTAWILRQDESDNLPSGQQGRTSGPSRWRQGAGERLALTQDLADTCLNQCPGVYLLGYQTGRRGHCWDPYPQGTVVGPKLRTDYPFPWGLSSTSFLFILTINEEKKKKRSHLFLPPACWVLWFLSLLLLKWLPFPFHTECLS